MDAFNILYGDKTYRLINGKRVFIVLKAGTFVQKFFKVLKVHFQCATFRKPCSGYKMKEMTGSGIFVANGEDEESEAAYATPNNRTGIRMYQVQTLVAD